MKIVRVLLISACFIGCTPQPPDVPVFESFTQRISTDQKTGHMILTPDPVCIKEINEIECGHGVFIVSKKQIFVGENVEHYFNGKPWSQLKRESIYVPAKESYAPMVQYIINSCAKSGCNDQIDRFKIQFDELRTVGSVLRGSP